MQNSTQISYKNTPVFRMLTISHRLTDDIQCCHLHCERPRMPCNGCPFLNCKCHCVSYRTSEVRRALGRILFFPTPPSNSQVWPRVEQQFDFLGTKAMASALDNTNTVLNDMLSHLGPFIDRCEKSLQTINQAFEKVSLISAMCLLYAIWRVRHQPDTVIALLVSRLSCHYSITELSSFLPRIFCASTAPRAEQQVGGDLIPQLVPYIPKLAVALILILGPKLCTGSFSLNPTSLFTFYTDMEKNKLVTIGNHFRAFTNIQQGFQPLIDVLSKCITQVLEFITGQPLSYAAKVQSRFSELADRFEALNNYSSQYDALVDTTKVAEVQDLLDALLHFGRDNDIKEMGNPQMYRDLLSMTRALHTRLVDCSNRKGKSRVPPLAINLVGNSGIGKSYLTDYIIKQLASYHNKLVAEDKIVGITYDLGDMSGLKYTFNRDDDYYSGYANQFSVNIDDFGQSVDSVQSPARDYMELINIVNDADYPLNSAHLMEKGKLKMCSRFVVCTSNLLKPQVKSINYLPALFRRFSIYATVAVKDQYLNSAKNLDKSKVPTFNPDIYNITLYDPLSFCSLNNKKETPFTQTISFPQLLDIIKIKYERQYAVATSKDDFMNDPNNFVQPDTPLDTTLCDQLENFISTNVVPIPRVVQQFAPDEEGDEVTFYDAIAEMDSRLFLDKLYSCTPVEAMREFCKAADSRVRDFYNTGLVARFRDCASMFISEKAIPFFKDWWPFLLGGVGLVAAAIWFFRRNKNTEDQQCKCRKTTKDKVFLLVEKSPQNKECARCAEVARLDRCAMTYQALLDRATQIYFGSTQQEVARDEVAYNTANVVFKNMWSIRIDGRSTKSAVLTCIRGRVALMNRHVFDALEGLPCILKNNSVTIDLTFTRDNMYAFDSAREYVDDLCLYVLPSNFPTQKTILHHFATSEEISHFQNLEQGELVTLDDSTNGFRSTLGRIHSRDVEVANANDETVVLRDGYTYDIPTQKGFCGSLLIAHEPRLRRKIIGMHELGILQKGENWGLSVTQKKIQSMLDKIPVEKQIHLAEHTWKDTDTLLKHDDEPLAVMNMGEIPDPPAQPTKTKIEPSPLHGKIEDYPPQCLPAVLRHPREDVLTKGLKKVANNPKAVDETLLERCADHYFGKAAVQRATTRRVFTYEEGVAGISEIGFTPIDRSTSPGYPWIHQRTNVALSGKKEWFGEGMTYEYSEVVRSKVTERIENARQGIRTECLWTDTLKDERRPKEKAMKPRVFAVGPQDYIIAVRMYFGAFGTAIMKNRIDNEVCVGINATSDEWTKLARHLVCHSTNIVAGDFSNYDGSLLIDVLRKICDKINEWYDDGEENKLIRSVLFEEICNGYHICRGHIYQWTHSQPSGNPMTVIINSVFNSIVMRIAWCLATKRTLIDFDKYVRLENYGDDNILSISDAVLDEFNQITMTEALAKIGLTYTDEAKTGELVKSRTIADVSFLKRAFRKEGNRYFGALSLATITEMPQWLRRTCDPRGDTALNLEKCLLELSLHDKGTYDRVSTVMLKAARQQGIDIQKIPYYDAQHEIVKRSNDAYGVELQIDLPEIDRTSMTMEYETQDTPAKGSTEQVSACTISRQERHVISETRGNDVGLGGAQGSSPTQTVSNHPQTSGQDIKPDNKTLKQYLTDLQVNDPHISFRITKQTIRLTLTHGTRHQIYVARSNFEKECNDKTTLPELFWHFVSDEDLSDREFLKIFQDLFGTIDGDSDSDEEFEYDGDCASGDDGYETGPESRFCNFELAMWALKKYARLAAGWGFSAVETPFLFLMFFKNLRNLKGEVIDGQTVIAPENIMTAIPVLVKERERIKALPDKKERKQLLDKHDEMVCGFHTVCALVTSVNEELITPDILQWVVGLIEHRIHGNAVPTKIQIVRLLMHTIAPLATVLVGQYSTRAWWAMKIARYFVHTIWNIQQAMNIQNHYDDNPGEALFPWEMFRETEAMMSIGNISGDPKTTMRTVRREVLESSHVQQEVSAGRGRTFLDFATASAVGLMTKGWEQLCQTMLQRFHPYRIGEHHDWWVMSKMRQMGPAWFSRLYRLVKLAPKALMEEVFFPTWEARKVLCLGEAFESWADNITIDSNTRISDVLDGRTITNALVRWLPSAVLHYTLTTHPIFRVNLFSRVVAHTLFNVLATEYGLFNTASLGDTVTKEETVIGDTSSGGEELSKVTHDDDQNRNVEEIAKTAEVKDLKSDLYEQLSRWIALGKIKLLETSQVGEIVASYSLPEVMFTRFIEHRLSGAKILQTDFEFAILINGTRFDLGQVLMYFNPYNHMKGDYEALTLVSQSGYQSVRVRVGQKETGTLKIKGVLPHRGYDLTARLTSQTYGFGTLNVSIVNPLLTADDVQNVECSVWGRLVNPKLSVQQAVLLSLGEALSAVGGTVKAVASVVKSTGIPGLAEAASTVEAVAKMFGFAKPQTVEAVRPFALLPGLDWFHSRGGVPGYVLGYDQKDFSAVCSEVTDEDEMSVPYLMAQQCYHAGTRWTRVDEGLIPELSLVVCPTRHFDKYTENNMVLYDTDYLGVLGENHHLWTGGIEYEVEVLAHMGQSGRIRVGIFPADVAIPMVGLEDFDNVPNYILDLSDNITSLKFTVENHNMTDWLNTSVPSAKIVFYVVNQLRSTAGTPQDAWINVWRKGVVNGPARTRFVFPRIQIVPQTEPSTGSDGSESPGPLEVTDLSAARPHVELQIYLPEDSPSVNSVNSEERNNSCTADETKSIKDLVNIMGQVAEFTTESNHHMAMTVNTFSKKDYNMKDYRSPLSLYSSLYRFYRGSRVIGLRSTKDVSICVRAAATGATYGYYYERVATVIPINLAGSMIQAVNGSLNQLATFIIPYYQQTPFHAVESNKHIDQSYPADNGLSEGVDSKVVEIFSEIDDATPIKVYESAGDDFQFMQLIGVPRFRGRDMSSN